MAERPVTKFTYDGVVVRKRSNIPHWHVPLGLYFVTYRLHDSLPRHVEERVMLMQADVRRLRAIDYHGESARAAEREMFRMVERELDRHAGSCHLSSEQVGELVFDSFARGDCERFRMLALTVMPNHVHLLFRLENGALDALIRDWKSYTAHEANKRLSRKGPFWQSDYYDVLIRDSRQLERTVAYILANPARAELPGWRWVRSWPERLASLY